MKVEIIYSSKGDSIEDEIEVEKFMAPQGSFDYWTFWPLSADEAKVLFIKKDLVDAVAATDEPVAVGGEHIGTIS